MLIHRLKTTRIAYGTVHMALVSMVIGILTQPFMVFGQKQGSPLSQNASLIHNMAYSDTMSVRIRIYHTLPSVTLGIAGTFRINTLPHESPVTHGHFLPTHTFGAVTGTFTLHGMAHKARGLWIEGAPHTLIFVNGRPFRGTITLTRENKTTFTVINTLSIGDYLRGVLTREISHEWPAEAIKAQAIISRTYALKKIAESGTAAYDMEASVYAQVYGGTYAEKQQTDKAIADTKHIFLRYNSDVFPVFYHASCGGMTEKADAVWSLKHPALQHVTCAFCTNSPHHTWQYKTTAQALSKALQSRKGGRHQPISSITIYNRSDSGRITWMGVAYPNGQLLKFSGNTLRLSVGPDKIRSTKFDMIQKGNTFIFKGNGWGHGVGFCQWGAKTLAEKQGLPAKEIISIYYPGVVITEGIHR